MLDVTLTGVHLGVYGRDLTPPSSLDQLLRAAADRHQRLLIRLGSLEPTDVPPALVDLAEAGRLAPAFHLPLQHASDRLLARMRRPVPGSPTTAAPSTICASACRMPRLDPTSSSASPARPMRTSIGSAIISRPARSRPCTSFRYSDRPGTEATGLADKVPGPVVRDRGRRVRDIGERLAARFRASQSGSERPALTIEDGSVAVTDNGFRVRTGPGHRRNERILVAVAF